MTNQEFNVKKGLGDSRRSSLLTESQDEETTYALNQWMEGIARAAASDKIRLNYIRLVFL